MCPGLCVTTRGSLASMTADYRCVDIKERKSHKTANEHGCYHGPTNKRELWYNRRLDEHRT